MSDSFFGGTSYGSMDTLTPEQMGLLNTVINQYGNIGTMASNMRSTYQGASDDYFESAIGSPLRSQYRDTLSSLSHTGKRHSSYTANQKKKLDQDFLTQLSSQRAQFANQERLREMQAAENLRQAQMGLYGLQNQVGNLALGTKAFENYAQQDIGTLGKISSVMNLGTSMAGMFVGM